LVLAFDTSAAHCAAALLSGDQLIAERHEPMEKGQAERLMPMLAELLAEAGVAWRDLARIGVRMHLQVVDQTTLVDRTQARRFEAWHGSRGAAADPAATERHWSTGGAGNVVGYSNPLVDDLYDAGRREFDRTKRGEKYGRIQEHLWEDQPVTWLYWRNGLYGFSRDLRGIVFSPRGPYTYSPGTRSLWRPPR
jgi:peptide/nickel transport system substrate-binding protein